MTALATKPSQEHVLALSLRARTSLLLSGVKVEKAPVFDGPMHGPLCEYCAARIHRGVHWAVAGGRSCGLVLRSTNTVGHRVPGTTRVV
jgi:hypothetical protein